MEFFGKNKIKEDSNNDGPRINPLKIERSARPCFLCRNQSSSSKTQHGIVQPKKV
jgi:hypothetical protein